MSRNETIAVAVLAVLLTVAVLAGCTTRDSSGDLFKVVQHNYRR